MSKLYPHGSTMQTVFHKGRRYRITREDHSVTVDVYVRRPFGDGVLSHWRRVLFEDEGPTIKAVLSKEERGW